VILISSLGLAITFPQFLHLVTSNGSYIGIMTLTFGAGLSGCMHAYAMNKKLDRLIGQKAAEKVGKGWGTNKLVFIVLLMLRKQYVGKEYKLI